MFFAETNRNALDGLPLLLCTIGQSPAQRRVVRPNGMDSHQILWITAGRAVVTCGTQRRELAAGDAFLSRQGTAHAYESVHGTLSTAYITFRGADGLLDYFQLKDSSFFTMPPATIHAAQELQRRCESGSSAAERSAALYSWLTDLFTTLSAAHISPAETVRRYMDQHYQQPLTLDELADIADISRFSLCRLFSAEFGETVMQYLRRVRIEKAREYLKYTEYTVAEIGQLCGYDDLGYFGRVFREHAGMTPGAYRRSHRS